MTPAIKRYRATIKRLEEKLGWTNDLLDHERRENGQLVMRLSVALHKLGLREGDIREEIAEAHMARRRAQPHLAHERSHE